MNKDIPDD